MAIPVHNGAATIGKAIDSLLAQTYPHWTATVCDNCSKDETRTIVGAYADSRMRLVEAREFMPLAANWSRCLSAVEGEFFQLLCADDYVHEACFADKMAVASSPEGREAVLFTSNRQLVGKDGKPLFAVGYSKRAGKFSFADFAAKSLGNLNPIGDPSTGLVRASALGDFAFSGKYTLYIDCELWLHILWQGPFLHVPSPLSYFRISGSALSASRLLGQYRETLRYYREEIGPVHGKGSLQSIFAYATFTARLLGRKLAYGIWG